MAKLWCALGVIMLVSVPGSTSKKLYLDPVTAELVTCHQADQSYGNSVSVQCSPKGRPGTTISFSSRSGKPPAITCSHDKEPKYSNTIYCEHDEGYFKFTMHEGGGISVQTVGGSTSVINGLGNVFVNGGNVGLRGGFVTRRGGVSSKDSQYTPVEIPPVVIPPVNIPPVVIPPVVIPKIPAVIIPPVVIPRIPSVVIPAIASAGFGSNQQTQGTSYAVYSTPAGESTVASARSFNSGDIRPGHRFAAKTGSGGSGAGYAGKPGRRVYSARAGGSAVFTTVVDGHQVHVVRSAGGASVITINVDGRRVSLVTSATGARIITGALPGVDMDAFYDRILQQVE